MNIEDYLKLTAEDRRRVPKEYLPKEVIKLDDYLKMSESDKRNLSKDYLPNELLEIENLWFSNPYIKQKMNMETFKRMPTKKMLKVSCNIMDDELLASFKDIIALRQKKADKRASNAKLKKNLKKNSEKLAVDKIVALKALQKKSNLRNKIRILKEQYSKLKEQLNKTKNQPKIDVGYSAEGYEQKKRYIKKNLKKNKK